MKCLFRSTRSNQPRYEGPLVILIERRWRKRNIQRATRPVHHGAWISIDRLKPAASFVAREDPLTNFHAFQYTQSNPSTSNRISRRVFFVESYRHRPTDLPVHAANSRARTALSRSLPTEHVFFDVAFSCIDLVFTFFIYVLSLFIFLFSPDRMCATFVNPLTHHIIWRSAFSICILTISQMCYRNLLFV